MVRFFENNLGRAFHRAFAGVMVCGSVVHPRQGGTGISYSRFGEDI